MTKIEKTIKDTIEPIINNLNYKLYDVIYEKESGENYLRIFIDNDNTISINDCEIVNNAITDVLDEKDFIKNQYILEVSSPGLERRIRDDNQLIGCIGKKVNVNLYKKEQFLNTKEVVGILKSFDEKSIFIKIINENEHKNNKKHINVAKENDIYINNMKNNDTKNISKNIENKHEEENVNKDENQFDESIIQIEKSNIAKMNTVFDM